MKILIAQPKYEKNLIQLQTIMQENPSVDVVIFPEGYMNENVSEACSLARSYNTMIISGYRKPLERPKDQAVMINRKGELVIDRVKYSCTSFVEVEGLKIGHILCDELILQGLKGAQDQNIDLIVHPIGVGMFSQEQFDQWITEGRKIAVTHETMIIGTSHADGSFRDSDISIPIAYCIDKYGNVVFIANNDVRTRIFEMETQQVWILN